jgi:hypothetical protein
MDLLTHNQDPIIDENMDYLSELTKPGAKYDRTKYQSEAEMYKEIAKGKWHADQTLEVSKRRQDELRADFLKEREQNLTREQLESALTRFAQTPLASNEKTPVNEAADKPTYDPNQLKTLVSQGFMEMRQKENEEANAKMVEGKLIERFGSNYQDTLTRQAVDLGLSLQEVNSMAKTNPKVFMRTFGLDQPPQTQNFQTPPRSSMNFTPTGGTKRTWAYYQKIKADKPGDYYSPKIQNQMVADYTSLGTAFEDGDFHQYN